MCNHEKRCATCGKILEVEGDRTSTDCGGDCVECMATAGDPDCMQIMLEVTGDLKYIPPDSNIIDIDKV